MEKPPYTAKPITRKEYLKYTAAQWHGVKVVTVAELRNGYTLIPIGTILEIHDKKSGFTLTGPRCACCNISPSITRVQAYCLEVAPQTPPVLAS